MEDIPKRQVLEWEEADTFTELLELSKKHIRGEITNSLFYCGGLDAETYTLVDGLLELHDLGIMTIGSQPFSRHLGVDRNKKYYEEWQRPSLDCAMEGGDQARKIFGALKEREKEKKDIIVYGAELFEWTPLQGEWHTDAITITCESQTFEGLCEAKFKPYTFFSCPGKELNEVKNKAWETAKPLVFYIMGISWNENTDLIEIVKEAAGKE